MRCTDWTLMVLVWTRCIGIAYFEETIYRDPMSSVTFYCHPSQTSVQYIWKLVQPQKTEILFTTHANLTSDKYYFLESRYRSWDLVLKTVMKRHAGTYLCQEFVRTGIVTLENYTLVVNGPPELSPNIPWLNTVPVIEGNTAELRCDVTGSPPPSISWFAMEDGQIRSIHIEGHILQIRNITRACGTKYVCIAENRRSTKPLLNMTFDLDVQFPAQILLYDAKSPRRDVTSAILNRKLGMEVILRCDVMMYPEVTINWKIRNLKNSQLRKIASYIPGVGISEHDRRKTVYTFKFQVIPNKKVTIFDVIFRTDKEETFSEYVCETEGQQFPSTQKSIKIEKLP